MDLGLAGRVAVVTGASRGIGRAVSEALVHEGCHVVACARGAGDLDDLAAALGGGGARVRTVTVDVCDEGAGASAASAALGTFGRLDVLVNNAGSAVAKPLADVTDSDWRDAFEVNFFAAVRMAAACVPPMRDRGWGRVIHIASTSASEPDPWFGPYSAAKAALVNFSKSLALAYSADGVLSNCLVAGVTRTGMVEANAEAAALASGSSTDQVMSRMMKRHPVAAGRFGAPAEIAAAVVFLASEQASWTTGACLAVDGGTLRAVR